MAIAKLLGFDLCPRLKALKDRHLFLPHDRDIPEILGSICHANIDLAKITAQWEQIVHLVASVHSGHTSAIQVLARFGAAARGESVNSLKRSIYSVAWPATRPSSKMRCRRSPTR
jgi:TnpA family transposase